MKVLMHFSFAFFLTTVFAIQPLPAQDNSFTDLRVNSAIESSLYRTSNGKFHRVDAETNNGTVTLTGSVDNLVARNDAEEIAGSIRGVTSTDNQIIVNAPPRPDIQIANDIEASIHADPATDAYDTRVAVGSGIAVLTGTASSYQEKRLVEEIVSGVTGVRQIQNNIAVTYREETADDKVRADIVARLQGANWIDESQINVNVNQGAVVISGQVASAAEKRMAARNAWVQGTKSVNDADLSVMSKPGEMRRRTAKVSDQQVANSVRRALNYNPRVTSENVGVAVLNGIVTLTGKVDSFAAKQSAEYSANDVYGAWAVRNSLRVRQTETVSDDDIATASRMALARDAFVDRSEITVRSTNGHTHLYGTVDSDYERRRAEQVVSSLRGVVHVANHLNVSRPLTQTSDWEIQKSIEQQLFWSPYVNLGEVAVAVDNGIATLSGKVDTWGELKAAEQNARDGGARMVTNKLEVDFGPSVTDIFK